ncbi:MAG: hypothetical protein KF819_03710 [Labilithrix sp.]|nr:hypothetical protein [Labilithrix sp.]
MGLLRSVALVALVGGCNLLNGSSSLEVVGENAPCVGCDPRDGGGGGAEGGDGLSIVAPPSVAVARGSSIAIVATSEGAAEIMASAIAGVTVVAGAVESGRSTITISPSAAAAIGPVVLEIRARAGDREASQTVSVNILEEGALDESFGDAGIARVDLGGASDVAEAVFVDPDGKIVVAGSNGAAFVAARLDASGKLDPTFGEGGRAIVEFGGPATARAIARDGFGRYVLFGDASNDIAIARLLANGTLDTTFAGAGKRTDDISNGADVGYAVALAPAGQIYGAGFRFAAGPGQDLLVVRYTAGGAPDPSWAFNGRFILDFANAADRVHAMAVQPDGKVVVAGHANVGGPDGIDTMVARLDVNGTPDPSFAGNDGVNVEAFGGDDRAFALALQPDGKIVTAGQGGNPRRAAFLRLDANGTRDATFDGDGKATHAVGGTEDVARGLVLAPGVGFLAVGSARTGATTDAFLLSLTDAGALDATGKRGARTFDWAPGANDGATAVARAPDGRLVVVGNAGADVVVMRVWP